ncbi:MAG TPA: sigma-70 family RNA polymerase sigma factor [Anaeromyxobacteraceae bacterium]
MPASREEAGEAYRSLVARATAGDTVAFRALYHRWRPAVSRVARSFADLDADDAEDVVQDSFVRAFSHLGRLRDGSLFGPWLLTIARNRARTRLARMRSASEMAAGLAREADVDGGAAPPADPGAAAEIELVRRVVEELPEGPEKETVRLFYLDGTQSARELAARLGVGKSAITMRLERFRAKVKRRILAEVARLRGEES